MGKAIRNVFVGAISLAMIFVIFSLIYYFEFPDPNPDPNNKNLWWLWALLSTLVFMMILLVLWFVQRQSAVKRMVQTTTQNIAQRAGFVRLSPSSVSNTITSSLLQF
jgi:O-antigen/teichoic acid export membrane protein